MPALLLASRNPHKLQEIRQLFEPEWEVLDVAGFPEAPEVEETGETFEDNAVLKAVAISGLFAGLVLADDSGLEVDALGGAPGVHSARFAGPGATDANNRHLLQQKLRAFDQVRFPARFRCVMALAKKKEILGTFAGVVDGTVITRERGTGGFGYDSMFIPNGYDRTFGELPSTIKNSLSHRARALDQVREFLGKRQVR
ncbi:MAG TPA: RdgB/HAM1 family non-canonical purine NTP pyrophosphatase [Chthoniobacterales bacterium]